MEREMNKDLVLRSVFNVMTRQKRSLTIGGAIFAIVLSCFTGLEQKLVERMSLPLGACEASHGDTVVLCSTTRLFV
jgi:hypothetical protein